MLPKAFKIGKRLFLLLKFFHIDIKNGKLWVQEDATDFDLVGELENKGVPREDIVLGFHAPYKRPHTGYAVA